MAAVAQGAHDRIRNLALHSSFTPQHAILTLLLSFIVGSIALSNQQRVVIPAATLSTARAPDHRSLAGDNNSCLERVC